MTSGKALNTTWTSPICIKHVEGHCYVAVKILIARFNDHLFIVLFSVRRDMSYSF